MGLQRQGDGRPGRTPGEESWLNAKVGAGNWSQYVASFSVGGPISDNWAASLAAQINNKDGQRKNRSTGQDTGLERNAAARAKLGKDKYRVRYIERMASPFEQLMSGFAGSRIGAMWLKDSDFARALLLKTMPETAARS